VVVNEADKTGLNIANLCSAIVNWQSKGFSGRIGVKFSGAVGNSGDYAYWLGNSAQSLKWVWWWWW
jgi:hypothetical protein